MKFGYLAAALALAALLFSGAARAETATPFDAREPVRMTLEECIKMGLERNPELGVTEAQADQAASQVTQAKANRYPSVDMSATVVRTNTLPDFATGDPTFFNTSVPTTPGVPVHVHQLGFPGFEFTSTREGDIYNAKIEAQYALYAGGRIKNGIEVAELNEDTAREQVRLKQNELVFNIEQAFYRVLLTQEMVALVDDAYQTANAHLRQVKALYNEGLVSDLDLLRTESAVADIVPQQIQAKNGLRLARLALNNYLNIDLDTPVEAVGSIDYTPHHLPLAEDLYARALANRPEMKTMEIRQEMADKLLDIARANAYPTVGLFANYAWDKGQDTPPNDQIWQDGYQAGVAVSVPLFDGFETKGKVAEAQAQAMQIRRGREAIELGIRTQVQQAVFNLQSAEERIRAHDKAVEAAEKNHEAAKARYSAGLATNIDVMDAQSQLLQARTARLEAVHDHTMAWTALQAALGMPERR